MNDLPPLRPGQRAAVDFALRHPRCAIWAGLGRGKTRIGITLIDELLESLDATRVLVIAGTKRIATNTWPEQIAEWRMRASWGSLATGKPAREKLLAKPLPDVCVVNVDVLHALVGELARRVQEWPWDMVIVDESSKFRDQSSHRWKALKSRLRHIDRLVHLTATPAANSLEALWPQTYLLDRGARLFPTVTQFRKRWFDENIYTYRREPKAGAREEIQARIADITFRLPDVEGAQQNPEPVDIRVELPAELARRYRQFEKDAVMAIGDGEVNAATAGALGMKLRQFANGFVYRQTEDGARVAESIHDCKLAALQELLEAAGGENAMVVYAFEEDVAMLKAGLPGALHYKEPGALEHWTRGDLPVLLIHPAGGGHGLNLQGGGSLVIWYGMTTDNELYQQTNGRVDRSGQTGQVRIYRLLTAGTRDEHMPAILAGRETEQSLLRDAMRGVK